MSNGTTSFRDKFIAGGIAGTAELLIMYPLDVVKTRAQLSVGKNIKVMDTFVDLIQSKRFGIYRGILPPFMIEAPKRAVKFSSFETYKHLLGDGGSRYSVVLAGCLAGGTEAVVIVPFDLIKIKLQAQGSKHLYKNTFDAAHKILRSGGIKGVYSGLESTLWRNVTWNGGYFGVIFQIKSFFPEANSKLETLMFNFISGTIAGIVGTTINTPFDVVKSRIQYQGDKSLWTLPSLVNLVKTEGLKAAYKGYIPKVMRLGPGGGIMLVVFEAVMAILKN